MQAELEKKLQYLELDPFNPNLLADVAHLHINMGEFEKALDYIARGLEKSPGHPALNFAQGTLAIASNNPDEAIRILNNLKQNSDIVAPEVYYNLAYAHLLNGHADLAKEELDAIVGTEKQIPQSLLLHSRVNHHLGLMDEAEKCAYEYIQEFPSDPEGLGIMALLKLDMQADDATEWADKALAFNENNLEGLVTKGSLALNELDKHQAESYFDKAVKAHSKSGRAHAGLGLINMANMDLSSARNELEKAVEFMPGHIGTWHALAWCQILLNDLQAAKRSFEKANEVDRNFGETYGGLAVIAAMEGKVDQAKELSKKGIGLDPRSFSARYAQSLIIAQLGGSARATKMIEKILDAEVEEGSGSLKELLIKLQHNPHNKKQDHNH